MTRPAPGAVVPAGTSLTVLVSAGFPRIAFADGADVQLIDGATGRRVGAAAATAALEEDPAWAPDGAHVAYVADGRVLVADARRPGAPPEALTQDNAYKNLAWSPRGNVLAVGRGPARDSDLCLLSVRRAAAPSCKREPSFELALALHWAPDGRSILATGRRTGTSAPGIVRWTTTQPFSPDARAWSDGEFLTAIGEPGHGVIDVAPSPDGKRLAAVANVGTDEYRLWLTDADDLSLERAQRTRLRACKVAWRGDGRELAITQADRGCVETYGALVRLDPLHPEQTTHVAVKANDPSYEPMRPSG